MKEATIRPLKSSDKENLFSILSQNEWPFHSGSKITLERFEKQFEDGYYTRESVLTFIIEKNEESIGLVRLFDLGVDFEDDETPLFDIRIQSKDQKQGLGTSVLKQVVDFVFNNYPNKTRIEATTRLDNLGMRKVLANCNFAKEAHYRNAWNCQDGSKTDAIGYGILRQDWEKNEITKLDWNS